MTVLSAYSIKQGKTTEKVSSIDATIESTDTIGTQRTLNDIRFNGWERNDWLDNEYIRTLRKYLDDYYAGKVGNSDLDPYKEQIKGKFVIYSIEPCLSGESQTLSLTGKQRT